MWTAWRDAVAEDVTWNEVVWQRLCDTDFSVRTGGVRAGQTTVRHAAYTSHAAGAGCTSSASAGADASPSDRVGSAAADSHLARAGGVAALTRADMQSTNLSRKVQAAQDALHPRAVYTTLFAHRQRCLHDDWLQQRVQALRGSSVTPDFVRGLMMTTGTAHAVGWTGNPWTSWGIDLFGALWPWR
ncbi:hypothetical protein EON66_09350 [archaeon]|nr:MAG: hypothetical protein EON66_09350 [archaeon]